MFSQKTPKISDKPEDPEVISKPGIQYPTGLGVEVFNVQPYKGGIFGYNFLGYPVDATTGKSLEFSEITPSYVPGKS